MNPTPQPGDPYEIVRHACTLGYDAGRVALALGLDPDAANLEDLGGPGGERVAHDAQGGAGTDSVDHMEKRF